MVNKNIQCITIKDTKYPEKLRHIYAPPQSLYVIGDINILNEKGIAIIGCRNCSKYGAEKAYQFGCELSKKGVNVISGLARGIDTFGHKGAIKGEGKTIAVLGSGLDTIYPPENKKLCREIIERGGAIITEYPNGTQPLKYHFPARNRIISGLSDGILVIESKKKSGTLITVEYGLEQGKDIYAIPGNIDNENSYGTNDLIKQGAIPVTSIDDFWNL